MPRILALGMHKARKPGRRNTERQRGTPTRNVDGQVELGRTREHMGQQANGAEGLTRFVIGHLVARGAVHVVEGGLRNATLGNIPKIPHVGGLRKARSATVEGRPLKAHEVLQF